jgi:hypothetical protein
MDDSSEWKQVKKPFPKLNRAAVVLFASGLVAGMFLTGLILFSLSEYTPEPIGQYKILLFLHSTILNFILDY